MTPIISIIMPVYNSEKYLERAIKSVVDQTEENWELILVDDGSTDHTSEICDEAKDNDDRVRVIHQQNSGPSAARNNGLKCSTGKYIAFIDSDDVIHPLYMEILLANIRAVNADISICSALQTEDLASVLGQQPSRSYSVFRSENDNAIIRHYLLDTGHKAWAVWGKIVRREIAMQCAFDENRRFAEDQAVTYKWFAKASIVVDTDDLLYCWYMNPDGLTRKDYNISLVGKLDTLSEIMEYLSQHTELQDVYEQYLHRFIYNAAHQITQLTKMEKVELAKSVKTKLKGVIAGNRKKYNLSPETDPDGFNAAYPARMNIYWRVKSLAKK